MQTLFIESTRKTPEIKFSTDENIYSIKGMSAPEDVRAMYYPVIEWIRIFVDDIIEGAVKVYSKENPFRLNIDLSYFNSSSAKFLFDILSELKRLALADVPVIIVWLYEKEDVEMKEAGTDFAELVGMEFIYVPKPKI